MLNQCGHVHGKGRVSLWLSNANWGPYGYQTANHPQRYTIEGIDAGERFGTAVAMSSSGKQSTVVVGSYDSSNSLGSVRAYQAQYMGSPGSVLGWYEIGTDGSSVDNYAQPTRGTAIVESSSRRL